MTGRQRASSARQAFGRAITPAVPAQVGVELAPVESRPEQEGGTHLVRPKVSKYTAKLPLETADTFDQVTLRLRRRLERHVDKLDILSAWISMTADDPTLLEQVAEELERRDG